MKKVVYIIGSLVILFLCQSVSAQMKIMKGKVKDSHSDEFLPFASVQFKNTNIGMVTDSSGAFQFNLYQWPSDVLLVSSIGYETFEYKIPAGRDSINILAPLNAGKASAEVVVKARLKHSRGWYLWRNVVRHRDENNIFQKDNFTYHVYNKLQVDINNINEDKILKSKLIKPFSKILYDNIDTLSEEQPILPIFLSETISDYYYQKNPYKTHEIITANKLSGVENESITKYLGALYQNVIIYNNFIPVFDKQFVSPFSSNGDNFYDYRLADTQRIAGRKFLHLVFIPKHTGENTFTGDCWVHDSTYAVQKVILHVNKEANINFVDKLSIVQEFKLINDSTWFLTNDKFYVTISPLGSKNAGFIARKTTSYANPVVNTPLVEEVVARNKVQEEVEVLEDVRDKAADFWQKARLDTLSRNEKGIYNMIDSIQAAPAYKRYYNTIFFLTTGYKNIGKFQIGPWSSWVSGNQWEGTRVRFDLGTNKKFSKNIYLHGYMAYGFGDKKTKGKAEVLWLLKNKPRQTLFASYTDDLNYSQNYNSQYQNDNILAVAIRKIGVPPKFINLKEARLQYFRDTKIGLSTTVSLSNKIFEPLKNIPGKAFFLTKNGEALNSTEVSVKFRFAYVEKFYETNFFRYSLGSQYPIADIEFTQGISGLLNSSYTYQKIAASISDQFSIAPYGSLNYYFFGGKVFGTLPYPFLEVHPGNEVYYYNSSAFNLMNRFEFVSDRYAGFAVEHNVGNGIFRLIPLTRKLKFRQFWNIRGVTGNLSEANEKLNFVGDHSFKSLNNKLYLEMGTGVDNIFKVFRLDLVWRLMPTPLPSNTSSRFGVFGSFKLQL